MGLIRFIFLLLVIGVAWFVVKNYLRKQELRATKDTPRIAARIVRCKHCDLHLPEQDAVRDGDDWFCTPAHQQAWLAKHKP